MAQTFNTWIDTHLREKGIDTEQQLTIEGPSGVNIMPVGTVIEAMKAAPTHEQTEIKRTLVILDYKHANPLHFIKHLAGALAR